MRRALSSLSLLAALALPCCHSLSEQDLANAAQDERMAWWRDARFGMFLHWGLYAIPAGKWTDHSNHGEWIRTTAQIPRDVYNKFQPEWNPVDFNADAWARMAKDAGMKYVVITSKHHDGFCLFDSDVTDWDVGNTPHRRDIMQELSDACRKHDLQFCTYHSIMDWHHPDYLPRRGWETERSTEGADFDRFETYLHAQVTEVITRYRPAVMWFDGEWEKTWTHERGVKLFDLCRRLAPEMIVNNRVDVHRQGMGGFSGSTEAVGDFDTPEQEIPATGLPGVDWESCMTMNSHWGWNAAVSKWKSTETLVRNLIDNASKGGNYLLNVGPRADGTFPPQAVERLAAIGDWMEQNGEAIHGTTASVFDSLPFGRCTVKADADTSKLYLHVFDWPQQRQLTLPGLANHVRRAYLLNAPSTGLATSRSDQGSVDIALPGRAPNSVASVVVVEIEGTPQVFKRPRIDASTNTFVHALDVTIESVGSDAPTRYTLDGSLPNATSPVATDVLTITQPCTVTAATFHRGQRVTEFTHRTFAKVTPRPAAAIKPTRSGLRVQRANVNWQQIPEDRSVFGDAVTRQANVSLPTDVEEHVAVRFTGLIQIERAELIRFLLTSDDGSRLWIDGQLVVDNDGLHGPIARPGDIALAAGWHQLDLIWFNATGGKELELLWAGPGQPFAKVPDERFGH